MNILQRFRKGQFVMPGAICDDFCKTRYVHSNCDHWKKR